MNQQHRKALYSFTTAALLILGAATPARAAVKIAGANDETFANLAVLLQGRIETTTDAAPDKRNPEFEAYMRRVRILLWGQIGPKLNFFLETDNPNLGRRGATSGSTYIQDAFIELNLSPMLQIDTGMILVPFSHMGMQSAAALLATDYHSALMKYPTGSNNVWRDWGLMVRGLLFDHYLEYRLGVFNGVRGDMTATETTNAAKTVKWLQPLDARNPADAPRFVGRLAFNLFDTEAGPGVGGIFTKGVYLKETDNGIVSPKRIVTVGASYDYQRDVVVDLEAAPAATTDPLTPRAVTGRNPYQAWDVDVFVDYPIAMEGLVAVTGQFNYYNYDYGTQNALRYNAGGTLQYSGTGFSTEVGARYDRYALVLNYDQFDADRGDLNNFGKAGDYKAQYATLVYWWHALAANVKLEIGRTTTGQKPPTGTTIKEVKATYAFLQTQLFF